MNAFSITGVTKAMAALDENNYVVIDSSLGDDWRELADAITELLDDMKVNYTVNEDSGICITILE